MFVSELRLAGFKSFADRTRLRLQPGVSVVVGPNGSGKSNLVDAIAWVLGTQAPSSLRTSRMDDVIFTGSSTRPPLGRAEVTLVLDNRDRSVPLDLDEISITRRLYRDGTSEYLIGGMECRLTDIQDLLSDTGVGRHQHTIVGQGQIDAVLAAGAHEQRAVIEEAAGVLKHRVRKERALRRLEQTETDLTRLRDIERELSRRVRPLKRQANAAGRYEELRKEMRSLRLHVDGGELSRLGSDLATTEEEDQARRRRAEEAANRLQAVDTAARSLEETTQGLRRQLETETTALARLETSLERFERIAQVAHERRRSAGSRVSEARERASELRALAEEAETSLQADRTRREELARLVEDATARSRSLRNEERMLADEANLPAEGVAAMLRGEISSLERADDRDREQLVEVDLKLQVLDEHLQMDGEERRHLDAEVRSLDTRASRAVDAYTEARESREAEQRRWEEADAGLAEARLRHGAALAAVTTLEQTVRRPEAAVEAPGVTADVISLLDVPDDLRVAVAAALEQWAESVALDRGQDMAAVVQDLRARGLSGFRVVRDPEPPAGESVGERVAKEWGLEPLTARLGPAARSHLASALLGDVVLVESWAVGWEVVRRNPEVRVVTPEGDLITDVGISCWGPEPAELLVEARAALAAAAVELARGESRLRSATRSFEAVRAAERTALEELERVEALLAGATQALDRAERDNSARQEERAQLAARRDGLQASLGERTMQVGNLRTRLAELTEESPEGRQLREEALRRLADVRGLRRQEEARREEGARELATVSERLRLLEERKELLTKELLQLPASEPRSVPRLATIEWVARQAQEIVTKHITSLTERQQRLEADTAEAGAQLNAALEERDCLRAEIDAIRERRSALGIRSTELRLRIEAVAEGLRRDLDVAPEEALGAPTPELADGKSAHARLEEIESELRRIGPINPLAAQEHLELSDRLAFLERQLRDVESSRQKLTKLIGAIDAEISSLFAAAFEQIADLFSEHFRILFPGGVGKLRLTEPDDILTSGVEILAQPLGKRISRLSLLSGGEKSLAALAFLFAVFRARPSPFYLLDEVEAALDDANLRRFLRLLEEIRYDAQLIIVTHQQQTMEAADVLYGITLEPGGSSQVVSRSLVPV